MKESNQKKYLLSITTLYLEADLAHPSTMFWINNEAITWMLSIFIALGLSCSHPSFALVLSCSTWPSILGVVTWFLQHTCPLLTHLDLYRLTFAGFYA